MAKYTLIRYGFVNYCFAVEQLTFTVYHSFDLRLKSKHSGDR